MEETGTTIILAAGDAALPDRIPDAGYVIAADGGATLGERLGLGIDLLIGDLDSVPPDLANRLERSGTEVRPHPADKDATDLELALSAAAERGPNRIVVLGGVGFDRPDHIFGNALSIGHTRPPVEWWIGGSRIHALRDGAIDISGTEGDIVSIVPLGDPTIASGSGLAWELRSDRLQPGSSRSTSNELTGTSARIAIEGGPALVVHIPGGAT